MTRLPIQESLPDWLDSSLDSPNDQASYADIVRVVSRPKPEPTKSIKQPIPLKSFKQLAPSRPLFKRQWSSTQCGLFLSREALGDYE